MNSSSFSNPKKTRESNWPAHQRQPKSPARWQDWYQVVLPTNLNVVLVCHKPLRVFVRGSITLKNRRPTYRIYAFSKPASETTICIYALNKPASGNHHLHLHSEKACHWIHHLSYWLFHRDVARASDTLAHPVQNRRRMCTVIIMVVVRYNHWKDGVWSGIIIKRVLHVFLLITEQTRIMTGEIHSGVCELGSLFLIPTEKFEIEAKL